LPSAATDKGRLFFFEKKNQKTFARLHPRKVGRRVRRVTRAQEQKFFASFFRKRSPFLTIALSRTALTRAERSMPDGSPQRSQCG
jgi:hypothetical protein